MSFCILRELNKCMLINYLLIRLSKRKIIEITKINNWSHSDLEFNRYGPVWADLCWIHSCVSHVISLEDSADLGYIYHLSGAQLQVG